MIDPKPRYLTKSRFKLALECPTKLFYTHKTEYANTKIEDSFLESLAQGGFQVGELAKMYFPEGITIPGIENGYDDAVIKTNELLQNEKVTIFEAAFLFNGLFIMVDILNKQGDQIELIEVKAKSISPANHEGFFNRNGLVSGWIPYLYDIAFQKHVVQLCYPQWNIKAALMLANKDSIATVNGLNQFFHIKKENTKTKIIKPDNLKLEDLGDPVLTKISVEEEIRFIYDNNPVDENRTFAQLIDYFKNEYTKNKKIITPIGRQCKTCEFRTTENNGLKSGFHECWKEQLNLSDKLINRPKVYDVWNFRRAARLMEEGKYFMHELTENDVEPDPVAGKISPGERQWLQIEKVKNEETDPMIEVEGLRDEINSWKYPLNFIDFETSAVALPFTSGRKPYEQTAFQFSHHIIYEDGRIEHFAEFLHTRPGVFPNFDFIRALKSSLETNDGSIFRYHSHENNIVNAIYHQLLNSAEPDKKELLEFIESISHSTESSVHKWPTGTNRDMIDLYRMVKDYVYDPATNGSISIKAVLPAVLNSSVYLKRKYARPIKELELTSKNFSEDHIFIKMDGDKTISPYKLLPPLFDGWTKEDLENRATEIDEIADGGAALTAYAKLQFEKISEQERKTIEAGLLKYCELDTLAMVMIYEYFREAIDNSPVKK